MSNVNSKVPGILLGKRDQLEHDKEVVKKLKPKLRKFVVTKQVQNAAKATQERKELAEKILSDKEVFKRSEFLATKAMLDFRIWQKYPPVLEMNWTKTGTSSQAAIEEMNGDIAGFAYYLQVEYQNFKLVTSKGFSYRNPMKEENIVYFWVLMQKKLTTLILAEKRRVEAGNKGVIIPTKADMKRINES